MAGMEGIEPSLAVLETAVLPLNDIPKVQANYSKRSLTKLIAGEIRVEMGEVPPAIGRRSRMRIRVPYWRMRLSYSTASSVGRKPLRIFSPSRGNTGTRLKIAREIFIIIMRGIMLAMRLSRARKLASIESMIARIMLLAGPARAIRAVSRLGLRRL